MSEWESGGRGAAGGAHEFPGGGLKGIRGAVISNPSKTKILPIVRRAIHIRQFDFRTEECSVDWLRRFIFILDNNSPAPFRRAHPHSCGTAAPRPPGRLNDHDLPPCSWPGSSRRGRPDGLIWGRRANHAARVG